MAVQYDFEVPAGVKVHPLRKVGGKSELTPETVVYVINRGLTPLIEKFDGEDRVIVPYTEGLNSMTLGEAQHFQSRCVVPGSRDPLTHQFQSFIGILGGVDPDDACRPFTPQECAAFGQKVESIDRTGQEADVVVVSMTQVRGRLPGGGAGRGRRPVVDVSEQATPEAAEAAATVFEAPELSEARAEIQAGEAELGRSSRRKRE